MAVKNFSHGEKEIVVIVGYGWVGQANALALSMLGHGVFFYDISDTPYYYTKYQSNYAPIKRIQNILEKDSAETVYIVCVGDRVSEKGEQDISNIKKVLETLEPSNGLVILRSTVRPDYLERLDFDIYLPEFLHEKTGVEECINPHFFVVGKKDTDTKLPFFFEGWKRRSYKSIECTPEEASHIKYLSNIWNAQRIAFVNEFGRSIHASQKKQEDELSRLQKTDTVLHFLFEDKPYFKYGRAYSGHCLPKDMRSYIAFSRAHIKPHFLEGVELSNKEQEKFQEIHHELKEWYSPWRRTYQSGREAIKALLAAIVRRGKNLIEK